MKISSLISARCCYWILLQDNRMCLIELLINVSLSFGWIQHLQNYLNRLIGRQHRTLENYDQEAQIILPFRKQKCRILIKLIDLYRHEPNVLRILEMLPKNTKITFNVWLQNLLVSFLIYMGAAILDCMTSLRNRLNNQQPNDVI